MMSFETRDVQTILKIVNEQNNDVEMKLSYNVTLNSVYAMDREKLVVCHAQLYTGEKQGLHNGVGEE